MILDTNFRLDESEPKEIPLNISLPELIRRNELGQLNSGKRVVPLILRTRDKSGTIMALPPGGDCFYCLTNPESKKANSGGLIFEQNSLYFAAGLINLNADRDSYRQQPLLTMGNYSTDLSFRNIAGDFEKAGVQLFKTLHDTNLYYDKKSWPNGNVPNLGRMTYEEALSLLEL